MKPSLRLSVVALLCVVMPLAAATIDVHNTGGAAQGSVDPYWLVNSSAVYVTLDGGGTYFPLSGAWVPNTIVSSWISPQADYSANGADAPGTYVYTTAFDLTGLDPNTASIDFRVAADNSLTDVLVNGSSTGITYGSFGVFSGTFNVSTGFIGGTNTLAFVTTNSAGTTKNPSGLRVEFTSATADPASAAVPEPASIGLLGLGMVLLFHRRRRHNS